MIKIFENVNFVFYMLLFRILDMPSSQEHNFVRYKITKSRYFPYRKISIRDSEPLISSTFPITRFSKRLLAKSEK